MLAHTWRVAPVNHAQLVAECVLLCRYRPQGPSLGELELVIASLLWKAYCKYQQCVCYMLWSSLFSARWCYVQPSPDPGSHRVPRGGRAGLSREAQPWISLWIAPGWGQGQQQLDSQLPVTHTSSNVAVGGWQGNVHFSSEAVVQSIKGINCYSLMQFC